jgi:hypothetical protein
MVKYRITFIISLVVLLLSGLITAERAEAGQASTSSPDTWQLEQGREWKPAQAKDEDKYLLAVARTEKLVSTGKAKALREEWNKLKKLFPEIAEQDLDIFIKAELLFCGGKFAKAAQTYNKFLDKDYYESRLFDAALERQFHIAKAFLDGRKIRVLGIFKIKGYDEGVKIMEGITDRAGDRAIALQAALAVAKSYEERKMLNEAYLKWSEISWQWKTGEIAKQALLSMAQNKHAVYRGPKYDASCLISAKSYYEDFRLRYPQDAKEIDVDKILQQIDEQLSYKQLSIGQYYQKIGNTLSANLYYNMVIQNWPKGSAAELAKKCLP